VLDADTLAQSDAYLRSDEELSPVTLRDTMVWRRYGATLILLHRGMPASDADWKEHSELIATDPTIRTQLIIVHPNYPGPHVRQRSGYANAVKLRAGNAPLSTSVVTPHRMHRGMITAINWFVGGAALAQPFPPAQLSAALAHLDLGDAEAAAIVSLASQLATVAGMSRDLRQVFSAEQ
jgi:hypothetical protein